MTPEQIAGNILYNHLSISVPADEMLRFKDAISTALRTARNEALEEAAQHHDARAAFLENQLTAFPVDKGIKFNTEAVFHRRQAADIRNLKHKDGQT